MSRTLLLFLVVLGGVTLSASEALARRGGLATGGCTGCHRGGTEPMVRITADPALIEPGGSTVLTIHISRTNGTTGGFYLTSNGKGVFADIAGQSTKRVADAEVVHSAPKTAVGDEVTFQVRWTAPATRGGVDFDVWGMSSNGDGSSRGDVEKHARLNFSFGCTGVNAYVDQDKDGFGALDELGPTRVCEIGPGYSAKTGDCNDGNKDVFPGAPELCNFSDDNCNGMVNEGLPQMKLYYDGDGDGFGVPPRSPTDTRDHCGPFMGYSARHGPGGEPGRHGDLRRLQGQRLQRQDRREQAGLRGGLVPPDLAELRRQGLHPGDAPRRDLQRVRRRLRRGDRQRQPL